MSLDSWNERELVEQAKQRDREAFNTLIGIHGRNILHFLERAWRVESPVKNAVDLFQETLAQAWKNIEMFQEKATEGSSSFINWLFGIARNVVRIAWREWLREQKFKKRLPEGLPPSQPKEGTDDLERDIIIRSCIDKMDSPHKEVLELVIDDYIDKEIAKILGRERATVRKQRNRGTKMLKEIMKRNSKGETYFEVTEKRGKEQC